jgi:hypothetical protein
VPNAGDDEKTFSSCCFRIESIVVCFVVSGNTYRLLNERVPHEDATEGRVKCTWSKLHI